MTFNAERASLVQQEYRYVTETSDSILSSNPLARTVTITTCADEATARTLALATISTTANPRIYEFTIDEVVGWSAIANQLPCWRYTNEAMRLNAVLFVPIEIVSTDISTTIIARAS